MENEKDNTFNYVTGVLAICAVIGWSLYYLFQCSPVIAGVAGFIIVGIVVYAIIWLRMIKSVDHIEEAICKQLDKQGFRHEKEDGTLYVIKNDNRFRVQLAEGINKRIKRLYIIYDFGDDDFEKVTSDGWNRAANSINLNNTSTTFVALSDHFCCCYQSAIESSRDFMLEFDRAYKAIGGALEDYGKIYPYLERDYPNNTENKTIGFK
ncbi:MAG: hypothetical protein IKW82_07615 [Bacteroidales bacterium]|nr:hypothetical protein [Bacteroidales bacterium]